MHQISNFHRFEDSDVEGVLKLQQNACRLALLGGDGGGKERWRWEGERWRWEREVEVGGRGGR